MSRLTRKEENGRYYIIEEIISLGDTSKEHITPIKTWITNCENRGYGEPINKLGKLEDLEEELGCPLDIVFKALMNGIYTKESELDNELELFVVRGIEKKGVSVISKFCSYAECDFTCEYKDYKKTWWLKENREE